MGGFLKYVQEIIRVGLKGKLKGSEKEERRGGGVGWTFPSSNLRGKQKPTGKEEKINNS